MFSLARQLAKIRRQSRTVAAVGPLLLFWAAGSLPVDSSKVVVSLYREESRNGPIVSQGLRDVCESLLLWQQSAGPFEPLHPPGVQKSSSRPDTVGLIFSLRLEGWLSSEDSPYQGIFSTGPVNSGVRAEVGPAGDVAVLVEDPSAGENAFVALGLDEAFGEDGSLSFSFEVQTDARPGRLSTGNAVVDLPTLSEGSCSSPQIGAGFSDDRVFVGSVEMSASAVTETVPTFSRGARTLARWMLMIYVAVFGAVWLYRKDVNRTGTPAAIFGEDSTDIKGFNESQTER